MTEFLFKERRASQWVIDLYYIVFTWIVAWILACLLVNAWSWATHPFPTLYRQVNLLLPVDLRDFFLCYYVLSFYCTFKLLCLKPSLVNSGLYISWFVFSVYTPMSFWAIDYTVVMAGVVEHWIKDGTYLWQ